MNKVEEKVEQLKNLYFNKVRVEEEYRTKRKGDIYYNTVKLIKSKVIRLKGELEQLSRQTINSWTIIYETEETYSIENRVNFKINSNLTSEEVISLFEYLHPERKVTTIKFIESLVIGIPRN